MPFQPGNKLAANRKPFRDALRLEIKGAGEDSKALRDVAAKLIEMARAGDMQAIKELADRVDGKVPTPVVGDDDHDPVTLLHKIERVIVDPPNSDSEGIPPVT